MNPHLRRGLFAALSLPLSFFGSTASAQGVLEALDVTEYEVQRLEITGDFHREVQVQLGGELVTLRLSPHHVRSPEFQVLVQGASGALEAVPAPVPRTVRGHVDEHPELDVVGSLIDGQVWATVFDGSATRFGIQPLASVQPGADAGLHVVYRGVDVLPIQGACEVLSAPTSIPVGPVQGGGTYGTGLGLCEIAFDTDFEYFQSRNSSVANVLDDIDLVMNAVSAIYEADCQLTYWITTVVVRTSEPDPYSSNNSSTLLNQLTNHWQGNLTFVKSDTTHMFTGKNLVGSTIGVAFLGVICGNNGYGLSQTNFSNNLTSRAALTAHELGHNWNANHCDGLGGCRIMCSGLGGCSGNITSFGANSISSITGFANGLGCIGDLALPLSIPFFEDVPGNINTDNWPLRQNVTSNNNGVNEPSPERSFNLDAVSSADHADDYIRSNEFLLSGASGVALSYWVEHRGVEAGEELIIEFLDDDRDWVEVDRVVSDGIDQNNYVFYLHDLPATALHDEFQVQFRAAVDDPGDDWFVDDIRVEPGCPVPTTYCVGAPNSFSPFGAFVTFSGSTRVSNNDFTLFANNAATNQNGIFYFGPDQIQVPFGDGFRCISGFTTRLGVITSDAFGFVQFDLDLTTLPGASMIQAGDNVNFQFWYRDPSAGGAGFNLSNALATTWCP